MSSLRDLRLSRKFNYAFAGVCLACALLGVASIAGFLKIGTAVNDIVVNSMPSMKVLGNIRYSVATIRRSDALLLLCKESSCTQRLTTKRRNYIAAYNAAIDEYSHRDFYPGEKELYEAIRENGAIRVVPATGQKREEAEFIMLRDGLIGFEGTAEELRHTTDPYLLEFMS